MTDVVIKCPVCEAAANFEFATWVNVGQHNSSYFRRSKFFEVRKGRDRLGQGYTAAVYFPGLNGGLHNIGDLPGNFVVEQWASKPNSAMHLRAIDGVLGVRTCSACGSRGKHVISWPGDAFFQIEFRGRNLWAFDRSTALRLLKYISSTEREKGITGVALSRVRLGFRSEHWFLRKVPGHFLTAKARPTIVRRLRKILELPAAGQR